MRLHRLKALEKQHRQDEPVAGRIPIIDRHDIGARRDADVTFVGIGHVADFPQDLLRHFVRGQLQRNPVSQRRFQRLVVQDRRVHQPAQKRLVLDGLLGLILDAGPDRIQFRQFCARLSHGRAPVSSGLDYTR